MSVDNENMFSKLPSSSDSDVEEMVLQEECSVIELINTNKVPNRLPEKRLREESEENDENEGEFTTIRRKSKRLLRSMSNNVDSNNDNEGKTEVSITSLEILPKQVRLAKLLREEKIQSIIKIKYKSPYKVLVLFENKNEADKLLKNTKFKDLGYRCLLTNEVSLSYGIIRNIDLETDINEMIEDLECMYDVISIRRLKRLTDKGQWSDSETIRVTFKSSTLPPYVIMYGCRFEVEPYIFPVTQCSGCWKYGHVVRFCPTKKIICPKCRGHHANCETTSFKCVNCNGDHMALNKICPQFTKEKEIRVIMSKENCVYRKALTIYFERRQNNTTVTENLVQPDPQAVRVPVAKKSYRDVVNSETSMAETSLPTITTNNENMRLNLEQDRSAPENASGGQKKKKNKKKQAEMSEEVSWNMSGSDEECRSNIEEMEFDETPSRKKGKFNFKNIYFEIKKIVFSNNTTAEKVKRVLNFIVKQITMFISNLIGRANWIEYALSMLFNG